VQKVEFETNGTGKYTVETDPAADVRPEIARLVVEKGCGLLELRAVNLSLEDIFMQLVTEETHEAAEEAGEGERSSGEGAES
jgi:ABC-2 type transport system ATP-binding protein